jgi:hypothetical protein
MLAPTQSPVKALLLGITLTTATLIAEEPAWKPLFEKDGAPAGFVVRHWADVGKPAQGSPEWQVKDGVLTSTGDRGCWLMSEKTYGDFELEYEFKLGPTGNSGLALRAPLQGDPAFDGLEMQMADPRYTANMKDSELTGGLYRALAPLKQVYKPEEWNKVRVRLEGPKIKAEINGETVQDTDLSKQDATGTRHNGQPATALKDRPRSGHIGFQELSRDNGHVMIRNARIRAITREK